MKEAILGISAYYHDSAACLFSDGEIKAAVQEERFTRIRHDASFPAHAIRYILDEVMDQQTKITAVAFYEKPFIKFERLLETYHAFAPRGLRSFLKAMPSWSREKLFIKNSIRKEMNKFNLGYGLEFYFPEHHLSHMASAFYPSPFEEAAILTVDGVGEWTTTAIGKGTGNGITVLRELHFPHSLGLLYSAFTYYCGFRVNSGEYKLMGLSPYGNHDGPEVAIFEKLIKEQLVDLRADGSFILNMDYFSFATGLEMTHTPKWERLFGFPRRAESEEITSNYVNLALAIQNITDEIMMALAVTVKNLTGSDKLVMAGGVALNCVANGKIASSGIFKDLWIQPAAGDSGGAVGAALAVHHIIRGAERTADRNDSMRGGYLGPEFHNDQLRRTFEKVNAVARFHDDLGALIVATAKLLDGGSVVGWFQGRMEFGPRALGNRSILGDPRNGDMQRKLNIKIKFREDFRPFAPAVLEEDFSRYFKGNSPNPYMLLVTQLDEKYRAGVPENFEAFGLPEKRAAAASPFPAVTHVDFSARVQSVSQKGNPVFWSLLNEFKKISGCGMLINTSFNVRGEPIVCSPEEAYNCFMNTDMDYLVIGNYLLDKRDQPIGNDAFQKRKFSPD